LSANALMAGDSMRSDVLPALEAGAWAAYIPQPLAWSHEQRPAPTDNPRFRELPSLAALVNWIDHIAEAA
jgi:putative hydrolase of the HAD superfamily